MQSNRQRAASDEERSQSFTAFARDAEQKLRIAFAAAVGQDRAGDAIAEALAYAWEHWDRVGSMDNPTGYLYRVGRSRVKVPRRLVLPAVPTGSTPEIEPALPLALAKLTDRQRVVVVLVHGFDWRHAEVAELLGIDRPTVATHLRRGLGKLRRHLKVDIDV